MIVRRCLRWLEGALERAGDLRETASAWAQAAIADSHEAEEKRRKAAYEASDLFKALKRIKELEAEVELTRELARDAGVRRSNRPIDANNLPPRSATYSALQQMRAHRLDGRGQK